MLKQQLGVSAKVYEDALERAGVDESYPLQLGNKSHIYVEISTTEGKNNNSNL